MEQAKHSYVTIYIRKSPKWGCILEGVKYSKTGYNFLNFLSFCFYHQGTGVHHFRPAVELTPMSYVVGGCTERYLGNINLFFIRESLSVREVGHCHKLSSLYKINQVHCICGNALTVKCFVVTVTRIK